MTESVENTVIQLEETDTKGRFWLNLDGSQAEMTFSKAGDRLMIIDHTQVPSAFAGKGAGARLVERGVAYARETGRRVVPLCPYAASQFRKHPEWQDVLDKQE